MNTDRQTNQKHMDIYFQVLKYIYIPEIDAVPFYLNMVWRYKRQYEQKCMNMRASLEHFRMFTFWSAISFDIMLLYLRT